MKKILSLLALLVTTVAAMASSFSDKLSYTIAGALGSNESQELTITDNGNGLYDISLPSLNTYNTIYMELGTMKFENVEGTTSGDVTIIETQATPTLIGASTAFLSQKQAL